MSGSVGELSREELLAERQRLLASIATDRHELETMTTYGGLSGAQFWVYEDIQSVEYPLGDDSADVSLDARQ